MANDRVNPTGLGRRIATILGGTVVIAAIGTSVFFAGTNPTGDLKAARGGSGAVVQRWGSTGSIVTAKMHSSGSLIMSGNLVAGHRRTGSGFIHVQGSDGGSICQTDSDGTGCTCNSCNNGVCVTFTGTTRQCSTPDAL